MKKIFLSAVLCSAVFGYSVDYLETRAFGPTISPTMTNRSDVDLAKCIVDKKRSGDDGIYSCMKIFQVFNLHDQFGVIYTKWDGNPHLTWGGWLQDTYADAFKKYVARTSGYFNGQQAVPTIDSRRLRENVFCVDYESSRAGSSAAPMDYNDFMRHQNGKTTNLSLNTGKTTIIDYDAKAYYYGEGHIQDVFRDFGVNNTGKLIVVASGVSPYSYFFSEQFTDKEISSKPDWYKFADYYLGYQHKDRRWGSGYNGIWDIYHKFAKFMRDDASCKFYDSEKGGNKGNDYLLLIEDFNNSSSMTGRGDTLTDRGYYTNDRCARYTEQFFLKNNAIYGPQEFNIGGSSQWNFMNMNYFLENPNYTGQNNLKGGLGKCYTINMDYYDGYSMDGAKTFQARNLRIGNFFYNNNIKDVDARYTQRFSPFVEAFTTTEFSIHKTRDGVENEREYKKARTWYDKRSDGMVERAGIMPRGDTEFRKISLHFRPTSFKKEYQFQADGSVKTLLGDAYKYNPNSNEAIGDYYLKNPIVKAHFKVVFYPDANKVRTRPIDQDGIKASTVIVKGNGKDNNKLYKIYKTLPAVELIPLYNNGRKDENLGIRYAYKKYKDYNECFDPNACKQEDLIDYQVDFVVKYKELAQDGDTYVATTDWKSTITKTSNLKLNSKISDSNDVLKFLFEGYGSSGLPIGKPLLVRVEIVGISEAGSNRPMFETSGTNIVEGNVSNDHFEEFVIGDYKSPAFGTAWNKNNINKKPTVEDYKKGDVTFGEDTYTRLSGESVYIGFDKHISNANIKFSMTKNGKPYDKFNVKGEYDNDVGKDVNTNHYGSNFIIEVDKPTAGKYEICYETVASNKEVLSKECKEFAIRPSKATIISKEQKAGDKLKDSKEIKIKYEGTDGNYSTSYEEAKITVDGKTFDAETKNKTTNILDKVSPTNPAPVVNEKAGIVIAYPFASDVELKLGSDTLLNDDKKDRKCDASSTSNQINPKTGMIGCDYEIVSGNISFKSENADELSDPKVNDPYTNSVLLSDENLSYCIDQLVCSLSALEQDYNIQEKGGSDLKYVYKKYDDDKKFEYKLNFANNKDPEYKERFRVYTNIENDGITVNQNQITINGNISKDILNKNFDSNLNKLDKLVNMENKKLSDVVSEFNANPIAYKTQVGYTKYEKVVGGSAAMNKNPAISKFDFTGSSLGSFSTSKDIPFIFAFAEFKDTKAEKGKVFKTIKASDMYIMYLDENKVSQELETSKSTNPYYTKPKMDILNGVEFKSDYLSDITKTTDGLTITLHKEKQKSQYVKDVIRMRGLGELDAKKSFTVEYILN